MSADVRPISGLAAIPVSLIDLGDNIRGHATDIDVLAASIHEIGVLEPLTVDRNGDGRYTLVFGQRRLLAARKAGLSHVPCLIVAPLLPDERLTRQLAENTGRVPLNPIQEARGYQTLRRLGRTVEQVAAVAAVSSATVHARLALLDLPADQQRRLVKGEITLGEARQVAQLVRTRTPGEVRHGKEPAHLTRRHPLAATVDCGHPDRPRIGGVGCGQCWEAAIRTDERTRAHVVPIRRGDVA